MKNERHMTAFYLETVLMVIIFVMVIAVLAQVFSQARMQSREAERMTNAVCLAQNAAEAVAAADSGEALLALLNEEENAVLAKEGTGAARLTAWYDETMQPLSAEAAKHTEEALRVETVWTPSTAAAASFVTGDIAVYLGERQEPVYTLQTGVYLRDEKAQERQEAER